MNILLASYNPIVRNISSEDEDSDSMDCIFMSCWYRFAPRNSEKAYSEISSWNWNRAVVMGWRTGHAGQRSGGQQKYVALPQLRDAMLRSAQEKWADGLPFIYTYRTCNYKKWVLNLCYEFSSHILPQAHLSCCIDFNCQFSLLYSSQIRCSVLRERKKNTKSPYIMRGFSKNWCIYSRFQYKWDPLCCQEHIQYKSNSILEFHPVWNIGPTHYLLDYATERTGDILISW